MERALNAVSGVRLADGEDDQVKRKLEWLSGHPGDRIEWVEGDRFGGWHALIRDGETVARYSDLDMLLDYLGAPRRDGDEPGLRPAVP